MIPTIQQQGFLDCVSSEEEPFKQAWKQLKQAQKQQASFEIEFDKVVRVYCEEILPKERFVLLQPCTALIEHLIPFLTRKNLTQAQRESLLNWLDRLIGNLFRLEKGAAEIFRTKIFTIIQHIEQAMQGKKLYDDFSAIYDSGVEPCYEVIPDAVVSKFDARSHNIYSIENITDTDLSFSRMTKSPWFISIFRKTAQALHPDREQVELKKKEKEQLMQQLVAARQDGNILQVLDLYITYVCDDPSLSLMEIEHVIRLIKDQTIKIKLQKEDYILRQPERVFAYDRIYAMTAQRQKQNMNDVIKEFYELRDSFIYCRNRIKDLSSLSTFL